MWKKIIYDDIETDYSVSDDGKVRNDITNKELKLRTQQGYKHVTLTINGKAKSCRVHRLVATAFIPNMNNKPYVNHIDCNRSNNRVENLEWVTPSENSKKAVQEGRWSNSSRLRAVVQYSLSGEKIRTFESASEAARQLNLLQGKITECCKGTRRRTGDFQWRYADEEHKNLPPIEKLNRPGTKVARCDDDLNVLQVYNSYKEAARDVQGTYQAIASICAGTTINIHHKGWRWKKVDDIVQSKD
jgi:hypothetical protein